MTDQTMRVIPSVGEAGRDTDASPGNGQFYVRLYDGSYGKNWLTSPAVDRVIHT
jgi:hypothetical protein